MSTISEYDRANVGAIIAGDGDWFSAQLLRLIRKADPENLERLRIAFPDHVEAFERWEAER